MESGQPTEGKKNFTPFIVAGVVLLLCCCLALLGFAAYTYILPAIQSTNGLVLDGTGYSGNADELLKSDVLKGIAFVEQTQNNCSDVSLLSGEILVAPDQTSDGSWSETWQVSACGESHLYSISFTPSPAGGTDYSVTRLDQ